MIDNETQALQQEISGREKMAMELRLFKETLMPDIEGIIDKRAHLVVGSLISTSRPPPQLASITAEASSESHLLHSNRSGSKILLPQAPRNETPVSTHQDPYRPSLHATPNKRDSPKG